MCGHSMPCLQQRESYLASYSASSRIWPTSNMLTHLGFFSYERDVIKHVSLPRCETNYLHKVADLLKKLSFAYFLCVQIPGRKTG